MVSQIEDKEIGFSAEEGNFPYIPSDLVGKAWPMVFGTVYDYPAVQMPMAVTGVTLGGVGIITDEDAYLNSPLYGNGTNVDLTKARSVAKQLHALGCAGRGCGLLDGHRRHEGKGPDGPGQQDHGPDCQGERRNGPPTTVCGE